MHGVRSSSSVRPTRGVLLVTVAFLPLVLACSPGPGASPPGDVTDVADAGPEADLAGWVDTVPEADALAEVEAPPEADALPETDVPSETGPWTGWTPAAWPLREMIGVASHMDQGPDPSPDRDFEFAHYAELGGGRIRQNMRWNKVEPADDQWRLDLYATQVSMAAERGIPLLPQVGYDVDWAKTGVGDSSLKPDEYAEYTARVASEFCWWIKDFECWNEENITRFWEPTPDAYRYGLMLKAAYPAIKAAFRLATRKWPWTPMTTMASGEVSMIVRNRSSLSRMASSARLRSVTSIRTERIHCSPSNSTASPE